MLNCQNLKAHPHLLNTTLVTPEAWVIAYYCYAIA